MFDDLKSECGELPTPEPIKVDPFPDIEPLAAEPLNIADIEELKADNPPADEIPLEEYFTIDGRL